VSLENTLMHQKEKPHFEVSGYKRLFLLAFFPVMFSFSYIGYFDALSISRCPRAVVEGAMKLYRLPVGTEATPNIDCMDLVPKPDNLDAGLSMNYHAEIFKLKTCPDPSPNILNELEFSEAKFCLQERAFVVNLMVVVKLYHAVFNRPRVRDQGGNVVRMCLSYS
jgi:hypothetical protein